MKIRNLLMSAAFALAVASTFAFKSESKGLMWFSYFAGGNCYIDNYFTDQQYCEDFFTGAQCTTGGVTPVYAYDYEGFPPPTCSVPLRRFN